MPAPPPPDPLPIDSLLPELVATLGRVPSAVLQAPPGAGKTTRVPLALAAAPWMAGRKVVVLEPRRLPVRMAARHMAASLGEAVGEQVGYRVRLESRVGPRTRVELVTDGLFLRQLQADPGLAGVGCVVFDEFHERGMVSDLALALALEAQALNPDLRLLVMSATLDAAPVARLLGGAPLLTSAGRAFPVELRWAGRAPVGRIEDLVAEATLRALKEETGSLLVFLPGQGEIRRVAERLAERLPPGTDLAPLYGDLETRAQDAAVQPAPPGRRKVVLATAIAETSLTIEGIRVVIDSGLARVPRYDPRSGMTRLETLRASQATATQRAGRAGRLEPGVCYRLWTEADHRARLPQPLPEILAGDPAPLALELALWGAGEGRELALLDPPPPGPLAQARALLTELGALDAGGQPTAHGRAMAALGLHPRLAHMLLAARETGQGRLACGLAALLSGRDLLRAAHDADLRPRVELLFRQGEDPRADRGALFEARALAQQWSQAARIGRDEPVESASSGAVLALAYPDRVAQARGQPGHFRLANGRGAVLPPEDPLAAAPWLAIAALDGAAERARIFLAAPITPEEIEQRFAGRIREERLVAWDARAEAVRILRRRCLAALVLEEKRDERADPAAVAAALAEGIRQLGHAALPWTPEARALQARIALLRRLWPEAWPDLSDAALLADPLAWLGGRLDGMTRRAHLARLDLRAALLDRLDWQQRRELDRLAPTHLPVPSGRAVALDYGGEAPVLAVKLQELFGQRTTPAVAEGRVPVVIHLLSPAGRPVQVTQDLEGFWKTGYPAVRGELRGRYPRHPWPDDPLTAPPQRGTKRSGR